MRFGIDLPPVPAEVPDDLHPDRLDHVGGIELRPDAVGQVARALVGLRSDVEGRSALLAELSELRAKLPPEVREGVDAVRLDDPESLADVLGDVEQMLLPALAALGSDE